MIKVKKLTRLRKLFFKRFFFIIYLFNFISSLFFKMASTCKMRLIIDEGVIVPSTVTVPAGDVDENTIVSILCWVNDPLSIVSLRIRRQLLMNCDPEFF